MTDNHFPPFQILNIFILFFIVASPAAQSSDADLMFQLKGSLVFITTNFWTDTDPCKWESVECNNGNVISIKLNRMGVRGTLPQSINQLKSLQVFDVRYNRLSGPLPTFSGMSSLKNLALHNNRFTKIPDDFFKGMTSLESVSLDKNPLEQWTIPACLADAVGLKSFSAISSNIVGKIPNFFGSTNGLAKLAILRLSFNYLEGEMPVEFSGSSIESLWLDRQFSSSKLTGSIDVLNNMTSLVDVWLHYNNFEGVIPNVSMATKLKEFVVNDNKLFGPVPQSLISSSSLKKVSLSNNLFQGKMPKFGDKVEVDNVGNSKYCSNSPEAECDSNVIILWKIAEQLKLPARVIKNWDGNDVCNWNGIACDSTKKNVTVISFQSMNLSGTIPSDFANLTSLERLYLQNNNLTGEIPASFGTLSNLVFIDVSYNQIIDNLPIFRSKAVVQGLVKSALKNKSLWKNVLKKNAWKSLKSLAKKKSLVKKILKKIKKKLKKKLSNKLKNKLNELKDKLIDKLKNGLEDLELPDIHC